MKSTPNRPLIIAHRGASAHAPENTLPAFHLAHEQGADGIELDVMLSKDHKLVVIHDHTLARTTNGTGRVDDHDYSALQKLDAGAWLSEDYKGTHLPLLKEVFQQLGGKLIINVELKNYHNPSTQLPRMAVALAQEHDLLDSVLFSSFNARNLTQIKKLEPKAKTGLLCLPGFIGSLYRGPFGKVFKYDALHPYFQDAKTSLIRRIHKQGKQINVWTVNKAEDLLKMQTLGVDAIITDDPLHARQVLGY